MPRITTAEVRLALPDDRFLSAAQVSALGPYLQGFLMERIDGSYASLLHGLAFNPYGQYCRKEGKDAVWRVSALTDEAAEHIIAPLLAIDEIELRSAGIVLQANRKVVETIDLKSLTDMIHGTSEPKAAIRFLTPTAFRSKGEYVLMPSVRLVLQNLLMHFCQVYEGSNEVEEETIGYIEQNVKIVSYDLRSQYYDHAAKGGRKIPAFVGKATLRISGPQPMAGLVRMLLKFGEHAGVGIKTSMGMGGMKCEFEDKGACRSGEGNERGGR